MTYYLDVPAAAQRFSIFALVQGSQCASVKDTYPEYIAFLTQVLKMAVLTVEKPGFPSNEKGCPREYLERNTIDQRITDFELVIRELRARLAAWDRTIYWNGGSEGAIVAGLLISQVPESKLGILMAGGGGFAMADELLVLRKKELMARGASKAEVNEALGALRSQFDQIYRNSNSTMNWYGDTNTYKWWASILRRDLVASLSKARVPLYIAHGNADTSVPVESSDHLVEQLGAAGLSNITYVRRDGLDHSWFDRNGNSHAEQVFSSAAIWMMVQEDQELRLRYMDLFRKDPKHPDLEQTAQRMVAVDHRNTAALKSLIARSGFPLISTHGEGANRNAWLLVQHADYDVEFQRDILELLKLALEKRDTHPADVAYLTDRVMVNERVQNGKPALQRFGTQGRLENGCWEPWPIEDEELLDARRKEYGMEPMAEYKRRVNELYVEPACLK